MAKKTKDTGVKTFEYTFEGLIPSKKNSKIIVCRGSRPMLIPSKKYKEWHEEQMWLLKKAVPSKPIEYVDAMWLEFGAGTRHKWDLTNKAESIMDILVDAGILEDDNHSVVPSLSLQFAGYDKERGHFCTVTFEY